MHSKIGSSTRALLCIPSSSVCMIQLVRSSNSRSWRCMITGGEQTKKRAIAKKEIKLKRAFLTQPLWGPWRAAVAIRRTRRGRTPLRIISLSQRSNILLSENVLAVPRMACGTRLFQACKFEQLLKLRPFELRHGRELELLFGCFSEGVCAFSLLGEGSAHALTACRSLKPRTSCATF